MPSGQAVPMKNAQNQFVGVPSDKINPNVRFLYIRKKA